jgi:hypothetical protein
VVFDRKSAALPTRGAFTWPGVCFHLRMQLLHGREMTSSSSMTASSSIQLVLSEILQHTFTPLQYVSALRWWTAEQRITMRFEEQKEANRFRRTVGFYLFLRYCTVPSWSAREGAPLEGAPLCTFPDATQAVGRARAVYTRLLQGSCRLQFISKQLHPRDEQEVMNETNTATHTTNTTNSTLTGGGNSGQAAFGGTCAKHAVELRCNVTSCSFD